MEIVLHHPIQALHASPTLESASSSQRRSAATTPATIPSLQPHSFCRFCSGIAPRPHRGKTRRRLLIARSKMFVPGFGSQSPEARAADTLHNYFTYLAVKIVLAQLEEYNPEAYKELTEFVDKTPLKDGDKFCAALMRESPRHKGLALRILEVRSAYASQDFEWDNMKRLTVQHAEKSNTTLMREFLVETSNME